LQEMRSLAWMWFLRLAQRGKDAGDYLSTFNDFLVRAVSSGRRIMGTEKAKDAMCVRTLKRRGFKVESLPNDFRASHKSIYSTVHGQQEHDTFEERLSDNSITPIPDQAAFRIDWPAWMQTQTERDRRIIDDLMAGERTFEVSRKYGLSPGRISQLRRRLHDDWEEFCAVPEGEQEAVA
jgi:Mor family transcriptional regulator